MRDIEEMYLKSWSDENLLPRMKMLFAGSPIPVYIFYINYFLCAHLEDAVLPEINTDGWQVAESRTHTSKG